MSIDAGVKINTFERFATFVLKFVFFIFFRNKGRFPGRFVY